MRVYWSLIHPSEWMGWHLIPKKRRESWVASYETKGIKGRLHNPSYLLVHTSHQVSVIQVTFFWKVVPLTRLPWLSLTDQDGSSSTKSHTLPCVSFWILRPKSHQLSYQLSYEPEVFDSPGGFGPGWRMGLLAADGFPRCALHGRLAAEFHVHGVAHDAHHLWGEPVGHRKASGAPWPKAADGSVDLMEDSGNDDDDDDDDKNSKNSNNDRKHNNSNDDNENGKVNDQSWAFPKIGVLIPHWSRSFCKILGRHYTIPPHQNKGVPFTSL